MVGAQGRARSSAHLVRIWIEGIGLFPSGSDHYMHGVLRTEIRDGALEGAPGGCNALLRKGCSDLSEGKLAIGECFRDHIAEPLSWRSFGAPVCHHEPAVKGVLYP